MPITHAGRFACCRPDQYVNGHFADEYSSNMIINQDFINRIGVHESDHHDMVHDASETMLDFGEGDDQLGRMLSDDPAQAKEQEAEALLEAAKAGVGNDEMLTSEGARELQEDYDLMESMPALMTEV